MFKFSIESSNKAKDLYLHRFNANSNQTEIEKYYEEYGYKYKPVNDDFEIIKTSNKEQIDCPQCTYQYKRYQINESMPIEPYSRPCPVCHFKFSVFASKEVNFQITAYYKKVKEEPPKKKIERKLYQETYKKLNIIIIFIILLLIQN